jgi:transcription elongation factor GreA
MLMQEGIAMSDANVYLTREGYEKLLRELEHFKTVRRRELSEAIGQARAMGDISENAEYDAAKDAQALNEKRIAELEEKLARAQIVDDAGISKDEVLFGATVTLKDLDTDEQLQYLLVSELEADYNQGKISVTSPVGEALLGHKENDIVEVKVPAGKLRYKILKITR